MILRYMTLLAPARHKHRSTWSCTAEYLVDWSDKREEEEARAFSAYVDADGELVEIVQPQWFAGRNKPMSEVPLPWRGSGRKLKLLVQSTLK